MPRLVEFITNHPLLVAATIAMIIAALVYELLLRARGTAAVSPQQAVRLINQGAIVMDIRDAGTFGSRHIVDAVNVTAGEVSSDPQGRLKKKRPVLLVCDTGTQSSRLVSSLRKAGFDNTGSLSGGLAAWERENLPLVSAKNKA